MVHLRCKQHNHQPFFGKGCFKRESVCFYVLKFYFQDLLWALLPHIPQSDGVVIACGHKFLTLKPELGSIIAAWRASFWITGNSKLPSFHLVNSPRPERPSHDPSVLKSQLTIFAYQMYTSLGEARNIHVSECLKSKIFESHCYLSSLPLQKLFCCLEAAVLICHRKTPKICHHKTPRTQRFQASKR